MDASAFGPKPERGSLGEVAIVIPVVDPDRKLVALVEEHGSGAEHDALCEGLKARVVCVVTHRTNLGKDKR